MTRGWYQPDSIPAGRFLVPAAVGWFVVSPLLMWFPAGPDPGPVWAAVGANAFHAVWFLAGASLMRRAWNPRRIPAWFGLVILGAVFEIGQHWIPFRDPSWLDETLNAVGAALGLWFPRALPAAGAPGKDSDKVDRRSLKSRP